jgi:hypothetical protein
MPAGVGWCCSPETRPGNRLKQRGNWIMLEPEFSKLNRGAPTARACGPALVSRFFTPEFGLKVSGH